MDKVLAEQESAGNEVGACTNPFLHIWQIFWVDIGPTNWCFGEFIPLPLEHLAPNWQFAIIVWVQYERSPLRKGVKIEVEKRYNVKECK